MPPPNEAPSVSSYRMAKRRAQAAAARTTSQWQTGAATSPAAGRRGRTTLRPRIGLGLLGLFFLGSAAALVYHLILLPARTPLVAAVALEYRWPLPPNAWTREDLDGLIDTLDGETFQIAEVSLKGPASHDELARQLETAADRAAPGGVVVVYLSAHAALDGAGQPCLLLPEADPVDSDTWFRLTDLLAQLKSIEQRVACRHLLILDAHRQSANWSIGRLDDGVSERIAEAVRQAAAPNLVVLNSASPGQLGCTSLQLRGSVFGYWLRRGLAGEADKDESGQVWLRELVVYLQQQVDGWAQAHRGARQVPLLCPADARDFPLAWTLNPRHLRRLSQPDDRPATASDLPSGEKRARLWQQHDELAALRPGHFAPHRGQQLEHELLWLDQAAAAGPGYRAVVDQLGERLEGEFRSLLEQVRGRSGPEAHSPVQLAAALAADSSLVHAELAAPSPALAAYLGLPASAAGGAGELPLSRLLTRDRVDARWPDPQLKQQVLALHELGDQLAVPRSRQDAAADSRAHRLVRPLLDRCDQVRRTIEDRLFGGGSSTTELARQVADAERRYREVEGRQATLARAYQLRDRAWAALPYLAAWSCGQPKQARHAAADSAPAPAGAKLGAEQQVAALSALTGQLDQALQQAERSASTLEDSPEALSNVDNLAAKTQEQMEALQASLDDEARRLALPGPATAQGLRALAGLLATPLVPAKLRAPLDARYLAVALEVDVPAAAGDAPPPPVDVGETAGRAICPPVRLAAAMLPREAGQMPADAKSNLPALGESLRRALRQAVQSGTDASSTAAVPPRRDDPAAGKPGTSEDSWEQDRRLRRLAALAGTAARDPFQPLRRRALQELLLWHGQRAIDDFWAAPDPDRPSYFATAGRACLDDVPRLGPPDPPIVRESQRLRDLLEHRSQAARTGLEILSTDLLLIDEAADLTAQIGLRTTPQTPDLPAGSAAVCLRDERGPLPGTIRLIELPPDTKTSANGVRRVPIPLAGKDLAGRGPGLQAMVAFRGHEFTTPVTLRQLHGPRIELARHRYGPSRITLAGAERRTASIVFVLDCSQSMRESIEVEAPDVAGAPSQATKLKVAVDALRDILERFGERGDTRIGVRFFGHRVGWRTDQPGTLARREKYPEAIPPTLRPYADVELSLPLGRFDSVVAGNVIRRLEPLQPWGESPIYLALRQALQDFGPPDAQADKRVVVITDGANNQFNPPPEFAPVLAEIQEAYANQSVRIEILGFAIPADEQAAASREFSQLAQATGGSFSAVSNASSLIRDLQRQLVKTKFRVLQGETVLGQAEMGGTVQLDPVPDCVIEVDRVRDSARLAGGERLQLGLSRDGRHIIALPYEEGYPLFAPLIAPAGGQDTNYRVGFHRPVRSGESVVFPLSFQTVDGAIPVRPEHVWIEIAPVIRDRSGAGESYIFFDANYEPDLPVPVMHCRCPDWPAEAALAELRVWCLPQAIEDAEAVPLAEVADRLPPSENGFPVKRLSGVGYQVRQIAPHNSAARLRVVQRHEAGTPVNSLKLDLAPPARRCVRQFDAGQGVVLHDFEYDAKELPPAASVTLRWQTRDELTAAAWRLDRPVKLGVARQDEVVVPPQILDLKPPAGR